jgi:hypothetical protein
VADATPKKDVVEGGDGIRAAADRKQAAPGSAPVTAINTIVTAPTRPSVVSERVLFSSHLLCYEVFLL